MLHTITKVPEELTLHEAPMFQSYGIEYVSGAWEEVDACLDALATKAIGQGHELKFVLTTGVFGSAGFEFKFRSRLPLFTEKGTLTFLTNPPTPHPNYSYARGPF
jgi:hypothetical protein